MFLFFLWEEKTAALCHFAHLSLEGNIFRIWQFDAWKKRNTSGKEAKKAKSWTFFGATFTVLSGGKLSSEGDSTKNRLGHWQKKEEEKKKGKNKKR